MYERLKATEKRLDDLKVKCAAVSASYKQLVESLQRTHDMTNQAKQASLDGIIARTNQALGGANLPKQEREMLQHMYEQRIVQLENENY
jgi:uncharacterized protein YsxB (DUF464 family)